MLKNLLPLQRLQFYINLSNPKTKNWQIVIKEYIFSRFFRLSKM